MRGSPLLTKQLPAFFPRPSRPSSSSSTSGNRTSLSGFYETIAVQSYGKKASTMASSAACIFCKIIKGKIFLRWPLDIVAIDKHVSLTRSTGDIPSFKLFENDKVLAFLDIQPLSRGHAVRLNHRFSHRILSWFAETVPNSSGLISTARDSQVPWLQTHRNPGRGP